MANIATDRDQRCFGPVGGGSGKSISIGRIKWDGMDIHRLFVLIAANRFNRCSFSASLDLVDVQLVSRPSSSASSRCLAGVGKYLLLNKPVQLLEGKLCRRKTCCDYSGEGIRVLILDLLHQVTKVLNLCLQ
jgi:hypothetical protein